MDTILKNKKAIIVLAALLIAFYVLSMIFSGIGTGTGENAPESNADLVEIADELSTIQFKQEIFTNPAYTQLVDFTAPLPTDTPGRTNPFDLIGR